MARMNQSIGARNREEAIVLVEADAIDQAEIALLVIGPNENGPKEPNVQNDQNVQNGK
jgi:hypothetical protein